MESIILTFLSFSSLFSYISHSIPQKMCQLSLLHKKREIPVLVLIETNVTDTIWVWVIKKLLVRPTYRDSYLFISPFTLSQSIMENNTHTILFLFIYLFLHILVYFLFLLILHYSPHWVITWLHTSPSMYQKNTQVHLPSLFPFNLFSFSFNSPSDANCVLCIFLLNKR